jgi:hypothetical protein
MNIKPTSSRPITPMGDKFEKFTTKTMDNNDVKLNEVDNALNEKEQSLKRKIFKLGKMETLVHSDPKLSAKYNEMAENGEEKYGYHYNETIMNMLFNDYVLNSMKYLQKYKNSPEAKKKRRDKSGIHKLQQDAEKKVQKAATKDRRMSLAAESVVTHNNSLEGVPYMEDDTLKEEGDAGVASSASSGQYSQGLDYENKVDETTGSASSGAYVGPGVWGSGDLMKVKGKSNAMKKPIWQGGTIIQESNYLVDPSGFEKYYNLLTEKHSYLEEAESSDDDIQRFSKLLNDLRQKGNVSFDSLTQAAKENNLDVATVMKKIGQVRKQQKEYQPVDEEPEDIDFIQKNSEAYGSLNNMNDDNLDIIKKDIVTRKLDSPNLETETYHNNPNYIGFSKFDDYTAEIWNILEDELGMDHEVVIDLLNKQLPFMGKRFKEGRKPDEVAKELSGMGNNNLNEKAVSKAQQKFMGMVRGVQKGDIKPSKVGDKVADAAKSMKAKDVKDFASTKTEDLPEKVDESMVDPQQDSMVADNQMSMKQKPVNNTSQGAEGGVPAGFSTASSGAGMANETTKYISEMEELNKFNEDLEKFQKEMNELKEDKKPSALVMLDRLKTDNAKNFKKDFSKSDTEQTIKIDDELGDAEDGITDVGDDPYKLGEDIEKTELKSTKGEALKNVGNSANNKGDELPKRNQTDDESFYVNMIRGGQQNLVYDNKPDERFEERRKKDMGEEFYGRGEAYKEMMAKSPMYNKDTQPIEDGDDAVQFNNRKASEMGLSTRQGFVNNKKVSESVVTGKYLDAFKKTRIIDFKLGDSKKVEKIDENWSKLSFVGLGNKYTNRVELNEGVDSLLNEQEFFVDDNSNVYYVESKKSLNESEKKEKPAVNEEFNKMKHLIGYKSESYMNTKNNTRYVD